MNFDILINKHYNTPLNVPCSSEHKYKEVIDKGYGMYIDAIASCGEVAMFTQFFEIVKILNEEQNLSDSRYKSISRCIIKYFEELGFIGTGYLNKHKYMYLKQPAFAMSEGDYFTHRRTNLSKVLSTDKFLQSIIRLQYLIDNGAAYSFSNFQNQLMNITQDIYKKILDNGNLFKYDIKSIETIIELNEYKSIIAFLNSTHEYTNKLGIIRMIWAELGKEFMKISRYGQNISDTPTYLSINSLDDGRITIHYVPNIIMYDTLRNLDFYRSQNVKYFKMFFELSQNETKEIRHSYKDNNNLGPLHFNKIGYTVTVIGSDIDQLSNKVDILNKPYYKGDVYSPLVKPCEYVFIDISKYLSYASSFYTENKIFDKSYESLNNTINSLMGV